MTAPLQPTPAKERLWELDAWRGFALIGVCIVNFRNLNADLLSGERASRLLTAGLDWRMDRLVNILLANKAHTIFSFLFGIGIAILLERAARADVRGGGVVARRMIVLLAVGWAHFLLLYNGDILHQYALVGLMLILVSRLNNGAIALIGLALAFSRLVVEEQAFVLGLAGVAPAGSATGLETETLQATEASMGLLEFVRVNASLAIEAESHGVRRVFGLLYYLGRAMLGFAFWRSGWAQALFDSSSPRLWKLFGLLAAAGFLLTAHAELAAQGPAGSLQHLVYNGLRHANFLVMAAAYLVGLTVLSRAALLGPVRASLAAVGKMSLTNYILQSVGMALLIFGPGLGLGGAIGSSVAVGLACAFYLSQVAFSLVWTKRWGQGPLERAWRRLAYG